MKKYIFVALAALFLAPEITHADSFTVKTGVWSSSYESDLENKFRWDDALDGTFMNYNRWNLPFSDVKQNMAPIVLEYATILKGYQVVGGLRYHHISAGYSFYSLDTSGNMSRGKLNGGYVSDVEADAGVIIPLKKWKSNVTVRGGVLSHSFNFNYSEVIYGNSSLMVSGDSRYRTSSNHMYVRVTGDYELTKDLYLVGELQLPVTAGSGSWSYDFHRMGRLNNRYYYQLNSYNSGYRFTLNRAYAGFRYKVAEKLQVELGYMLEKGTSEFPGVKNIPISISNGSGSGLQYASDISAEISVREWAYDYFSYAKTEHTTKSGVYALISYSFNL